MAIQAQTREGQYGEDILGALASTEAFPDSALTTARLAAVTGRDPALVRRIVGDLLALGLVEYQPGTSRLRLGWSLYTYAARITQARLATSSQQVLTRLAQTCCESAWLVVRQGADAVTVAEATPSTLVQTFSWVGRSFPIVRSDAGPMLIADLADDDLDELLGDAPLPPTSARRAPRSLRGVKRLVASARSAGFSILDEQAEPGLTSVATPVCDFRGRLVAAVVVTGPAERIRPQLVEVTNAARAAAAELSGTLGSM